MDATFLSVKFCPFCDGTSIHVEKHNGRHEALFQCNSCLTIFTVMIQSNCVDMRVKKYE
jgi:hypothetical protein